MEAIRTDLGLVLITPKVFHDNRGYFFESYNYSTLNKELVRLGYNSVDFDQDNHSTSIKGVFRGFHYQVPPYAQSKLIWVSRGSIVDLAIDIRPNSPTFGMMEVFYLDDSNKRQLFIPKGFAHGFYAVKDDTKIHYKCDGYYMPGYEGGINVSYGLAELGLPRKELILSEKDSLLPDFGEHKPFV